MLMRLVTAPPAIWQARLASGVYSIAADNDGTVFAAGMGQLVAYDATTGRPRWSAVLEDRAPPGGIVFAGNRVLAVSGYYSGIWGLEKDTGARLWQFNTYVTSAPIIANEETVIAGGAALFVLDARTGKPRWSFIPDAVEWMQRKQGVIPPQQGIGVVETVAVWKDRVYCTVTSEPTEIVCLSADTGKVLWSKPWSGSRFSQTGNMLCVTSSGVLVGQQSVGPLVAFDARSGSKLWSLGGMDNNLYSIAPGDSGTVYTTGFEGVTALDAKTGKQVWNRSTEGGNVGAPFLTSNNVLAVDGSPNRIELLDARTGKLIDQYSLGTSFTALLGYPPHSLLAVSPDGKVLAVGSTNGKVMRLRH
jgi:outer membrane protein assembly factor BamB